MYTINSIKLHCPMAMRVLSGIPTVCMSMAPPEWIESVPMSSGENPSLFAPTLDVLVWIM